MSGSVHPSRSQLSNLLATVLLAFALVGPIYGQDESICYAVADNDAVGGSPDVLMTMNKTTAAVTTIGGTGTSAIEAIALDPETDVLYAANGGQLGILNSTTGAFTARPNPIGTCRLSGGGTVTVADVDGLFFDPYTLILWGSLRASGGAAVPDYVLNINTDTGQIVTDAFGAGVDCVAVTSVPPLFGDIDDIAIDPVDGTLYGIDNLSGSGDQLISINKTTGVATVIGPLSAGGSVADMEGLSFFNDGQMLGATGDDSVPAGNSNSLWLINKATGSTTLVGAFGTQVDYESLACLTAVANVITGTVFFDTDGDGTYEPLAGEAGEDGFTVRLYIDENSDGLVDGGDTLIQTTVTALDGSYSFSVAAEGDFVLDIDTSALPSGMQLTTDNVEEASFVGFGNTDADNDFGFRGAPFGVTKTSDVATSVNAGDTITYTIEVDNTTGSRQTGIEVLDVLPANTSYVAQSTTVIGRLNVIRVTEYFLSTIDFTGLTYDLTLDQDLSANYFAFVQGSDGAGGSGNSNRRDPDEDYAALTADPFGTGDLALSGSNDVITVEREDGDDSWVGVVTVVECLTDCADNGFILRDVQRVLHADGSSSGTDTSGTAWSDINQVALFGGFNGAGCTAPDSSRADHTMCHVRLFPSGTQTINWTRDPGESSPGNPATSTVMVVEWGSSWTVQRVRVQDTSANGGDGADQTSEYTTAAITSVARDNTWVWGTGFTDDNGVGDAAEGALITLGDGVNQNANESTVAVGLEFSEDIDFDVYVMTHADLATDYRFKSDGNSSDLTVDVTVDSATEDRMALVYNGAGSNNTEYPRPIFSARYVSNTSVRLERRRSGVTFPAWVQGIDFSGIRPLVTKDNIPAGANADLVDGTPSDLVEQGDGFFIPAGETLTVTFQVTVDNPLDPNVTRILNSVLVDSLESLPGSDSVNDPVSRGGTIGDRVWLDIDGDGVQDVGEPGLANVLVTLFNAGADMMVGGGDDTVVTTALTGINGLYLFDHLPPATYYVDVTSGVPGGLTLSPGSSDPSSTIAITAEEVVLTADFGYTTSGDAIIGDTVWSDADSDGIRDPGEPGIEGVTVELISAGVDGILGTGDDVVSATVLTGPDGSYLFTGVVAGEYLVEVDTGSAPLTGYTLTLGPQSQGNPTAPITVASGDVYLQADFGFNNPTTFSISDEVWLDADSDGTRDAGEIGFPNVVVNLLDGSGDVVATTTTDSNGDFSFDGLANGSYTVSVVDSADVLIGFGGTSAPALARSLAVAVAGADVSGINFGYVAPGTLGDTVWSDADGDGTQDPGEPGISGVTVQLWLDSDNNGIFDSTVDTLVGSRVTDAAGNYLFDGLIYGTYFASVDDSQAALSGYTPTTTDEEVGANAAGTQIEAALITLGAAFLDADFGYQNSALADVSGNVFEDLDIDGLDDGVGEPGISGVTIALVNTSGVTVATTTTDGAGDYSFPDVAPGDYTVVVTDDDGVLDSYSLTSGLDAIDIMVAGTDITGIDFGYVRGAGTASIGDRVWLDGDGDGIQDGAEDGIAGVTVELYDPGPNGVPGGGDDVLLQTTTTDVLGGYRFSGLSADNYFVEVDTSTLPGGGANLTATTSNPSALINLSEGEAYTEADFGFGSSGVLAAIGDFVWYDADGDGIQDPGEVGIGGVEIEITGPGCAPCTTTTDADGSYLFTGLAAGNYNVIYDPSTLPAGYNTAATNAADYDIILSAGEIIATADFGFNGGTTGTIGDFVWYDADGDGIQDAGEPGLAGVTLNLLDDATSAILATTTTDSSGGYDFVGLAAGTYRVAVTDVGGVLDGLSLSGGTNPTATIILAAGGDENGADFGYEPGLGSIGNLVWHDQNGDGDVDAGEPGLSGVTVELWLDVNGNGSLDLGIDNRLRQVVTDLNGEYSFTGLPAGDYLVDVTDDRGVLAGFTLTDGADDVDNNSQVDPYAVTLTSGALDTVVADFGYSVTAGALSISGITFFDLDGQGDIDPGDDFGVSSITVYLYRDLNGNGILDRADPLIGTQVSIVGGAYQFNNLPDGDYIVVANATGTFLDGSRQTTQLGSSAVQPVTLSGANSTDNDFGFTRRATVVLVSGFSASVDEGRVVVEWRTAAESNAAGFYLYRFDETTGEAQWLDEELLPALFGAPQGGIYRFVDTTASPLAESLTYALIEVEARGSELVHGPYQVTLRGEPLVDRTPADEMTSGAEPWLDAPSDGRFEARPHSPQASQLRRLMAQRTAARALHVERTKAAFARQLKLKLTVRDSGLHQVTAQTLADLYGISRTRASRLISRHRFLLTHRGAEIPWLATADGEAILFYGEKIDSPYTLDQVYWLSFDRGSPMAIRQGGEQPPVAIESFAEARIFEENRVPALVSDRDPEDDFWQWAGVIADHPSIGRQTLTLDLGAVASRPEAASLSIHLQGASESPVAAEHHAVLTLNGTSIGETYFDNFAVHEAAFTVPHALLRDGANELEVRGVLDTGALSSFFFIDRVAMSYERPYLAQDNRLLANTGRHDWITIGGFTRDAVRVFDISDPKHPVWLSDAGVSTTADGFQVTFQSTGSHRPFLAVADSAVATVGIAVDQPSNLLAFNQRVDYLVITTGELRSAADRLAEYRESTGYRTLVVELEDVMDELNHGIFDPRALSDFLAFTQSHWRSGPQLVVLAGAGNFDYRDLLGLGGNPLPPLMAATPYGLFASDNSLVDFNSDLLPDIQIGRLPVLTAGELDAMVDKIIAYEAGAGSCDVAEQVLLVADNRDDGGDFRAASEGIATFLPEAAIDRVYLDDQAIGTARQQLLAGLGQGGELMHYLGHGGIDRFAEESLLTTADVGALANRDRLPLVLSLTCNVARFEIPGFASLAETLLLDPDDGAIAVWAPTGLAHNFDATVLSEGFMAAYAHPSVTTLGDMIEAAFAASAQNGFYTFPVELYTLIGDPAVVPRRCP